MVEVYGIYLLEVVQTVLVTRDAWDLLITEWAMPQAIDGFQFDWLRFSFVNGIASSAARLFFTWQMRVLGGTWPLIGLIWLVSASSAR